VVVIELYFYSLQSAGWAGLSGCHLCPLVRTAQADRVSVRRLLSRRSGPLCIVRELNFSFCPKTGLLVHLKKTGSMDPTLLTGDGVPRTQHQCIRGTVCPSQHKWHNESRPKVCTQKHQMRRW